MWRSLTASVVWVFLLGVVPSMGLSPCPTLATVEAPTEEHGDDHHGAANHGEERQASHEGHGSHGEGPCDCLTTCVVCGPVVVSEPVGLVLQSEAPPPPIIEQESELDGPMATVYLRPLARPPPSL